MCEIDRFSLGLAVGPCAALLNKRRNARSLATVFQTVNASQSSALDPINETARKGLVWVT
ncbi:MAG: hypothetical protein ACI915_005567 [Gammaproteobacteria bacterium]|jgi:hypothetical protein